jgi:hypothetical protein
MAVAWLDIRMVAKGRRCGRKRQGKAYKAARRPFLSLDQQKHLQASRFYTQSANVLLRLLLSHNNPP